FEGTIEKIALPYVTLDMGDHSITGQWCGKAAPRLGAKAVTGVRAERVRLSDTQESDPSANGFSCRRTASVYKGKYLDLTLDTPIGPIRSRLWDVGAAPTEPTYVHWSHDTCTV